MRFSVLHETEYRYSLPVSLGPHVLRLNPQPERVRVGARRLVVEPFPVAQYDFTDSFGNVVTQLNFAGACEIFRIRSEFEADSFAPELIRDTLLSPLPWIPGKDDLGAYCNLQEGAEIVRRFAVDIQREVADDPVAFLDWLNRIIHDRMDRHIRLSGAARTPAETLENAGGACRDLALLFIEACRCVGIPSRFVSGYQAAYDTPDQQRHLHAWAEVFLPGQGWRGWDPMHGVRVKDGHVALCVAPDQAGTMPVEGSFAFSGTEITSMLNYKILIHT